MFCRSDWVKRNFPWSVDGDWRYHMELLCICVIPFLMNNLSFLWQDRSGGSQYSNNSYGSSYGGLGSPVRPHNRFLSCLYFFLSVSFHIKAFPDTGRASAIFFTNPWKKWIVWEPLSQFWFLQFWITWWWTGIFRQPTVWFSTLWLHCWWWWWGRIINIVDLLFQK